MRITRDNWLLQLTWMPRLFPVNCYIVEEEKDLTLIDAGMSFSLNGILRTAESLGKPLARIVLTHAHDDHVGALDALKKELPQAELYISERDSALLRGDSSLRSGEPATPVRGGVPKSITSVPDHLLHDGDEIGSLTAIFTPGHTPGSMSFLDRRSGAVIAGDAFQTFRGTAVSGTVVPLFPFPAMATWNKEAALESAVKIQQLNPSLLAVGHGNLLKQPGERLRSAIAKAEAGLKPQGLTS
ncbi:MBL fold metallo-hydrolase [Paenibacillus sp. URB8-2]|uniref:MBL fold metallo-hydrolase n=1 Tax=Paenibacillus sp. URB8-2 TaxID=2741301 RepID=UPI0015C180D8|nr:MBL fold metallo-hydrolase [Paenibacillus sp. URB8-2]BCG59221.1 MBL fold metallo-hydrolase [Paenibacillus sp. URB8-2]